jgi:hypothetical protein
MGDRLIDQVVKVAGKTLGAVRLVTEAVEHNHRVAPLAKKVREKTRELLPRAAVLAQLGQLGQLGSTKKPQPRATATPRKAPAKRAGPPSKGGFKVKRGQKHSHTR